MGSKNMIVDCKQFPKYSDATHLFGIGNEFREQLYKFFKRYQQGIFYTISADDNKELLSYINADALGVYNSYGIYFKDGFRNTIKKYVLIIPADVFCSAASSPEVLEQYVASFCNAHDIESDSIEFCVVELGKDDQFKHIDRLLREGKSVAAYKNFFQHYDVENSGYSFRDTTYVSRYQNHKLFKNCKFINVATLVAKNGCLKSTVYLATLKLLAQLLDEMETLGSKDVMFYCSAQDLSIPYADCEVFRKDNCALLNSLYVKFAAYLTLKRNFKFDIPDDLFFSYQIEMASLLDPKFRYLDRYLEFLASGTAYAIKYSNGHQPFLCIRKPSKADYVSLVVQHVNLDIDESEQFCIRDKTVACSKILLSGIKLLHVTDFYQMHTRDFEQGRKEMLRLQRLLDIFQDALFEYNEKVDSFSLDCSNVIFYKDEAGYKLGYVSDINAQCNYKTQCFTRGYDFVEDKSFNLDELKALNDIRCYPDYGVLYKGDGSDFPALDDTAEGFIDTIMKHNPENITSSCGICYDSIGLWANCSSYLRGRSITGFATDCKLPIRGLRREFLSFFGGPHPYLGQGARDEKPVLNIGHELWRS